MHGNQRNDPETYCKGYESYEINSKAFTNTKFFQGINSAIVVVDCVELIESCCLKAIFEHGNVFDPNQVFWDIIRVHEKSTKYHKRNDQKWNKGHCYV